MKLHELTCEGCLKVSDDLYASIFHDVMICIICLNIEEERAQEEIERMDYEGRIDSMPSTLAP